MSESTRPGVVDALLDGDQAALASVISTIEDRESGYRDVVASLFPHAGDANVIGVTGSPGSGKSTLVDKLVSSYREAGKTVGVVAIDPSSPFTGGAVLGDRIRMASTAGDEGVFFRSMSTRGALGGVSTATLDAVTALDAFGKDVVIVETVGAGQNEVDVVSTTDTVVLLVPPSSGDDVQMLKAGILEIADVFVVNKADLVGTETTVTQLRSMLDRRERPEDGWEPPIVETVATTGAGVADLLSALSRRFEWLASGADGSERERRRIAAQIRRLLREDVAEVIEAEIDRRGGMDSLVDAILAGESDPYTTAGDLISPLERALERENG